MSAQKRISVEAVLEAYRVTGLKPRRGDWFSNLECACAGGAISAAAGVPRDSNSAYSWWKDQFGIEYAYGFTNGFDGHRRMAVNFERYQQGYEDGRAVAAAVFTPAQEQSNG